MQYGFNEPSVPVLKRLKKNIDIRDITHALARYAPDDSSHQLIPPRLAVIITLMISLMMGAIINGNSLPLFLLTLMLTSYFPLYVMAILLDVRTPLTLEFLADTQLPRYTVILPLYKGANMVGQITYSMRQINYPSKKIKFFYVVEESDLETYKALRKALSEALPTAL